MEKLAQRIAAISFHSSDKECAPYVVEGKTYPETYFRVGVLCRADADYDSADKLQELVGVQMKAAYPDRSKVVPLMDKALSPYVKGGGAKRYEEELKRQAKSALVAVEAAIAWSEKREEQLDELDDGEKEDDGRATGHDAHEWPARKRESSSWRAALIRIPSIWRLRLLPHGCMSASGRTARPRCRQRQCFL